MTLTFARHLVFMVGMSILFLICPGASSYGKPSLKEISSITGADLPGSYKGALLQAFDLSPDGNVLAAEFISGEGQTSNGPKLASVQVVEWDVENKKIIAMQKVEGPTPTSQLLPNPQYTLNIRFSPDGKKVIAQIGSRVQVLDSANLSALYSISIADAVSNSDKGITIRKFNVSGDSKLLAVLSSFAASPCEPTQARLFNIATGEKVAEWDLPEGACPQTISLSFDGSQMLFADLLIYPSSTPELVLVDSRTGKLLRTFDLGFAATGSPFAVGGAQFTGQDQFIAQIVVNMDAPAEVAKSTLVICDIRRGKLLHQLTYQAYGVRGIVAVASNAQVVAVLSHGPRHPEIPAKDDETLGFERLLLFHANEKEPFYISADRAPTEPTIHRNVNSAAAPLHVSSDGKVIAISEHDSVKVYEVVDPL